MLPPTHWQFPDLTGVPGNEFGLVAEGADLEPATLLNAYARGFFPMPIERRQIGWFSPDPRGIIPLDGVRVSRSLRRSIRRFDVRFDSSFAAVLAACADPTRPGAWIDERIAAAYGRLHELGWAHSVECWLDGALVGGLYGVRINRFFAGESMFHRVTDASKVALVALTSWLRDHGGLVLDVQWSTPHLASLGAVEVSRNRYLAMVREAVAAPATDRGADRHD